MSVTISNQKGDSRMRHMTFTGHIAGMTYCGRTRVPDGQEGVHMPYGLNGFDSAAFVAKHCTCEECRDVAFSVYGNPDQKELDI